MARILSRLAAGVRAWGRGSWVPLVCGGTRLPPNLLLSGKLLALWLLVHRGPIWRPEIHLPFVALLDHLGPAGPLLERGLTLAFLFFAVALLVNRSPRTSCFLLGAAVLMGIAMDRTTFSNNTAFAGCFLLLLGLHEPDRPPWLLRAQVVLVYFGAGLNKLLDPDWQSGVYFEFWTHTILEHELYIALAGALPPLVLSKAMGWFVIAVELSLAIGFSRPRLYRWVIPAGVLFHVGMLVFTGGVLSWLFLYVMGAAFVAVAPWPDTPLRVHYRGRWGSRVRTVLEPLDREGLYRWRRLSSSGAGAVGREPVGGDPSSRGPAVEIIAAWTEGERSRRTVYAGPAAFIMLLVVNPGSYFVAAGLLLWQPLPRFVRRVVGLTGI